MTSQTVIDSTTGVEKLVGATRMHMLFAAWVVVMRYLSFR